MTVTPYRYAKRKGNFIPAVYINAFPDFPDPCFFQEGEDRFGESVVGQKG